MSLIRTFRGFTHANGLLTDRTLLCVFATMNSGDNDYGYAYHFDIMAQSEVFGDNPIVDFEETSCPSAASSDYAQCECA